MVFVDRLYERVNPGAKLSLEVCQEGTDGQKEVI